MWEAIFRLIPNVRNRVLCIIMYVLYACIIMYVLYACIIMYVYI